jgi:hypothetical protein
VRHKEQAIFGLHHEIIIRLSTFVIGILVACLVVFAIIESTQSSNMSRELFAVQRCWYSGPQQYQPLDFLRLFPTQRDAEEAAYHSAHAWSRYHNPSSDASVRTLLLSQSPAHNTVGTSYGFIAHGSLFWVRSLAAHVADEHHEGYAVVTEGVIGGTGNKNSRRGMELGTGRVFVGQSSRMTALQACHEVIASLPQANSYVATVPIGKPNYVGGGFLKDWPPQVLQPNLVDNPGVSENKRESRWLGQEEEEREVECPFFEQPTAKRRRFCDLPGGSTMVHQEEKMLMG